MAASRGREGERYTGAKTERYIDRQTDQIDR